jgi:four helix bundle protein
MTVPVPGAGCRVRRYQDLECWRLADELKRECYRRLDDSPSATHDFDFARQLRRSASSGPANLAEGFGYYRHKESAKFIRIAKSSLTETDNHLVDGVDRGHWTARRCEATRHLADRAIGATTRWLKYLMSSEEPPLAQP